jgi:hypothetical protein
MAVVLLLCCATMRVIDRLQASVQQAIRDGDRCG